MMDFTFHFVMVIAAYHVDYAKKYVLSYIGLKIIILLRYVML